MNTNTYEGQGRQTAQILQFPVGGRRIVAAHGTSHEAIVAAIPQHICDALDNCWYHDDAIRQPAG